ncbi:hypothetical protein JCM14076_19010 [Methylosoma difficile]
MKVELLNIPFLTPQQIHEASMVLDAQHTGFLKVIERLNKDVAAKKLEISSRWKANEFMTPADAARYASNETSAAILKIRQTSKDELDKLFKEAGPAYNNLISQKPFYDSPVKVLSRIGLGSVERSRYLEQLEYAGPFELAHMGQFAVSTKDETLGAVVLSLLERIPNKDKPFGPAEFAVAMNPEDYKKVQGYIAVGEARIQGIVLAYRTWTMGKSNPLDTVGLALRMNRIDDGILAEFEAQNA